MQVVLRRMIGGDRQHSRQDPSGGRNVAAHERHLAPQAEEIGRRDDVTALVRLIDDALDQLDRLVEPAGVDEDARETRPEQETDRPKAVRIAHLDPAML